MATAAALQGTAAGQPEPQASMALLPSHVSTSAMGTAIEGAPASTHTHRKRRGVCRRRGTHRDTQGGGSAEVTEARKGTDSNPFHTMLQGIAAMVAMAVVVAAHTTQNT